MFLFCDFFKVLSQNQLFMHIVQPPLQELNNYLSVSTSTSVIVDKSSDGDFLRIDFNIRWHKYLLALFKYNISLWYLESHFDY